MVGIPAWCPSCNKMIDGSSGISFSGGAEFIGLTLTDSSVSCPECGGTARCIEGTFDIRGGIIDVVTASPWTRAKLAEYQSALKWATDHIESQPEEAVARIEASSPETGAYLRRLLTEPWSRADVLTFLGTLLALAALLQALIGDGPTEVHVHQINQIFNQAPEHFGWFGGPHSGP